MNEFTNVFERLGDILRPTEKDLCRICKYCEHFGFHVPEIGAGCCGNKFSPHYGWWGTEESTCPWFKKLTTIYDKK
jgi:hypothetical protein